MRRPAVLVTISLLCRLGLAGVWLASGWIKAVDPIQTETAVRAYQVLPEFSVSPVAVTLPYLEIGLGLLLLFGIGVRWTSVVSVGLLVVFIAGVSQAWVRGLSIDCGCFGGGGVADVGPADYLAELGRDIGFVALAVWLVRLPLSFAALGPGSRAVLEHDDGGEAEGDETTWGGQPA